MASSMHVIYVMVIRGQQVRLRVEGAVSDLHVADTQYHKGISAICKKST